MANMMGGEAREVEEFRDLKLIVPGSVVKLGFPFLVMYTGARNNSMIKFWKFLVQGEESCC